jgi:diadenosine tetraphosphatase ApaH/serine/threonine PP2A family protein phosphatase
MRILVLSDVHANLPALEASLKAAGQFDGVWCLGDLVGYGPNPNQCIERVRKLPNLICLLGNHDAATLGRIDLDTFNREAQLAVRWTRDHISPDNLNFLENLPETQVSGQVTLVHGSPRNPVWEYLLDPYSAQDNFAYFQTPYCFVGHTHLPIMFLPNSNGAAAYWKSLTPGQLTCLPEKAILNPGSVGQPRDHDARSGFAVFDTNDNSWIPIRVDYDVRGVIDEIRNAGLPARNALRLEEGW